MKKINNHPFLSGKHGEYLWCLHCERALRTEEAVKTDWDCVYDDCDGSALDMWDWDKFRKECRPEYPQIPEIGKQYPMYPQK